MAAQPPAEPPEPPENEGQELEQMQQMVEKLVAPLADKVDMLIDAVQQDTKKDATEGEAKPAQAQKPAKRRVVIERDQDGRMTGATLEDHPGAD